MIISILDLADTPTSAIVGLLIYVAKKKWETLQYCRGTNLVLSNFWQCKIIRTFAKNFKIIKPSHIMPKQNNLWRGSLRPRRPCLLSWPTLPLFLGQKLHDTLPLRTTPKSYVHIDPIPCLCRRQRQVIEWNLRYCEIF